MAIKHFTVSERFWKKVLVTEENDCWLYTGGVGWNGYGQFWADGINVRAHRTAWLLQTKEPIPEGMCVCHACDTPLCMNIKHLFLGTQIENVADRNRKGRNANGEKTNTSKLTEDQARYIKSSARKTKELVKEFGLTRSAIQKIRRGYTWAHLTPPALP